MRSIYDETLTSLSDFESLKRCEKHVGRVEIEKMLDNCGAMMYPDGNVWPCYVYSGNEYNIIITDRQNVVTSYGEKGEVVDCRHLCEELVLINDTFGTVFASRSGSENHYDGLNGHILVPAIEECMRMTYLIRSDPLADRLFSIVESGENFDRIRFNSYWHNPESVSPKINLGAMPSIEWNKSGVSPLGYTEVKVVIDYSPLVQFLEACSKVSNSINFEALGDIHKPSDLDQFMISRLKCRDGLDPACKYKIIDIEYRNKEGVSQAYELLQKMRKK